MKIVRVSLALGISVASMLAAPVDISVHANKQTIVGVVLHLKGQVEMVIGKLVIVADEADLNVATGDIEARGNVRGATNGSAVKDSPLAEKLNMNSKSPENVVLTMHLPPIG